MSEALVRGKIETEMEKRRNTIRPINQRIAKLREESVNIEVKISGERAKLITEFYKKEVGKGKSIPVQRALAFKYLMENVSLPVEDGQLIVGIRGTGVNEVPTYPEINVHSLDDLELLNERENMPYKVDEETKEIYKEEVIPFWKGRAMRDIIFENLPQEWMDAYESGVWTEFMEQRSPGHTAGGDRIFKMGILDIKNEIKRKMQELKPEDPEYYEKMEELKAMDIVADAIVIYAHRYAEKLQSMAKKEKDERRRKELEDMAKICRWVPEHAPRTFWEALQHYWFIHVGVTYETNPWDSFNPGRIDQNLYPFYEKDVKEGRLNRERAKELFQAFWLKFNNQPAVPKVGVTAEESFTYNDFSKLNVGGLTEDGYDGVNELSYLILEVLSEMRTLQLNTAVLISNRNPDRFLIEALKVVGPGFGEPPFFNYDELIVRMLRQGKSLEDARTSGVSGCVESGAFGKEAYILTGYFNLPKILEITLHNGIDPRTGKKVGIETGDVTEFKSFEELWDAFLKQVKYFLDIKMKGNDIIEALYAKYLPVPFLSLWIEDCVKNAKDYNVGGARYNTQYIQVVGLGTLTDSLVSIKYNVFDKKFFKMDEVIKALDNNFKGYELMRQRFLNRTPKFGNDDDYADEIAKRIVDVVVDMIESYPPSPIRKASKRAYFLPTTAHVYFGKVTGATPDGRIAGYPVSEGISPVQGMDRKGIAAVFRSVAKCDWAKTGGALLNQKLTGDLLENEENIKKLAALIRNFFRWGGHHVQFNVVSSEVLKEAQEKPPEFQDLMVRVAGYSDYFVNLPKGLQDEIIKRTEHEEV
ncbi:trans-4-hydroxy-L-proline dehydratase [Candidatus Aciduliprofundum boonei]|uniref:Formate C-acetyltransferase n=1 Tax=Aciduliprofundum boonei (strain DSM 19572 / T469) TaxID=439481 RepID=B5IEV9_ACIB4|nr:trans-4-hydroxy-L-proline dehydratase [Candidatus Aciduliprofundum boonei]ADD07981.1 Formate C-acetyltransferase [Aciduliprofundum boonei T469]EDY35251.1 Pyruvate formate lyase superfamily [Aciduliprofundum boonei T469]HII55150.1 glycyl radical protein [Candidatus Aciduliprofundum boonei]